MRATGPVAVLLLLIALLLQLPAVAQNASGSLSGTVTDSTGAVIPNAKVVLTNQQTGVTRETVSNGSGVFNFPAVQPSTYTVAVTTSGFNTWERKDIVFNQGSVINLPGIVLQVGETKEQVQVEASAEMVATESPHASQTLNQNMITELSIQGRDAAELIKIMPGMAMATGLGQNMWNSYTTASNTGPIGNFSAAGTQPNGAMTMTSDGANLLDPGNQGTQTANVNQNQVQEISILTSAYGAEYAKGPVTFQAIGKSGSAQFHGGAYLYARDGTFNSIDSFTKATTTDPKPINDRFWYPGGDLGGPVLIPGTKFNRNRDKLFFYAAYEYMKQQPAGSVHNYFVPTPEMMNGNFSRSYLDSLGTGFANGHSAMNVTPGGNAASNDGLVFPNGTIPKSLMDPNSIKYMSLFPQPGMDPHNPTGTNYQYFEGPPQNRWEFRIRGDYNISEKTKLFMSWNHQLEHTQNPIAIWWQIQPGSLPYPSGQNADQKSDVLSANLVHVFSPTLTNEFVFAKAKFVNPIMLTDPDAVNPDKLGFKMTGLFKNPYTPQIPNVFGWNNGINGFATYPYGSNWSPGGANGFGKLSDTPNISDNVTKVWGTHTLKTGFYWDFARNWQPSGINLDNSTQGVADYENWGARSSGNPMADLLLGRATVFNQWQDVPVSDFKYYQYSFYVSDAWKTTRRLTLTLGMRFDHMGNWVPEDGHPGLAVWDPTTYDDTSKAPGWTGLAWNGINSSIPRSGFKSRPLFFEPRFGMAYDLFGTGKTVIRGGAGLYRYQLAYNSVSGVAYAAPINVPHMSTTWGCCVGWNNFSDYSPSLGAAGLGSSIDGVLSKDDDRTPYTWTYNFTVSQRMPWRSVAEVQYQGNQSKDMMLSGPLSNINVIPYGAFFKADPVTGVINDPAGSNFPTADYRPFHNYTGISLKSHGSYSYYNSLVLTWQKQTGRSTFTTNYTFGKVLGIRDQQSDNGPAAGNTLFPYAMQPNYGVLAWDHTHIFNAAYVFTTPNFVKGRVAGMAINGWTLSGITQLQSGAPIQPNTGGTLNATWPGNFTASRYLGTDGVTLVPKLTCDPRSNLQSGQYYNPSCFAPPSGGTNGDIIWPYIKGPAFFNSDLAIYKDFQIRERQKIQLRFSAFNFLNHPLPQLDRDGSHNDVRLNFNDNNTLSSKNINALGTGYPMFTTGRRVIEFAAKYQF